MKIVFENLNPGLTSVDGYLMIRCLEEGAEEFFLKPVQLSDVNKLRPHLMKGKSQENEHNNKRKVDMGIIHSPERTRTRYNDLEVV